MSKKLHAIALVLAATSTLALAEGDSLPASLAATVAQARPDAKIVSFKACRLGAGAVESVGFLLRAKSGKDPFSLNLATKVGEGWKVSKLSRRVDYAQGVVPDILDDWASNPNQPYEIVCAAIPDKERGISASNNGRYVAPFSKSTAKGIRHLCFSASTVYNSWSCVSFAKDSLQVQPSFMQLNAD